MSDVEAELLGLERKGWQALSASGEEAAEFYGRVLAAEVLMLLPGGLVLDDREAIVESMSGAPWQSFELADERVLPLGGDAAVVAYRATADRPDGSYTALFNSTYVRDGDAWKLAVHQQTPV